MILLIATVLGVVINDSVFAVILGASFTSTIALMAWIVKTLAGLHVRVDNQGERIDRLENAYWTRQFGGVRAAVVSIVLIAMVVVFWGALFFQVDTEQRRERTECVSRQNLYDGHIVYTRFLADEFNATKEQTEAGLDRLRKALGPRPKC